ncbi:PepSY-associated TM helix domain-containing protein [Pontimicrobium sp. SW4]|uniref:PepSY-associated TM helix domain-containing protein n=1 Tax=Pontimicrobium sp. SW4 TaxID=3153519 RepID=A0AAU7BU21_9FLAO
MKFTNRAIHRDFGFFYFGLIIAFSFSGIILNHRQDWYPMDYVFESENISMTIPTELQKLNDKDYLIKISNQWTENKFDSHRLRDNQLRIYFKDNAIADIDIETGKGLLEYKRKVPFLGHTMYLHKTTNKFWIWYSDIFGAALILIAMTGILIPMGKKGFKQRGWKLAVLGILFPILFLILFS